MDTDLLPIGLPLAVSGGVDITPAAVHRPDRTDLIHGPPDQALLERNQCARRDGGLLLLILKLPGNG